MIHASAEQRSHAATVTLCGVRLVLRTAYATALRRTDFHNIVPSLILFCGPVSLPTLSRISIYCSHTVVVSSFHAVIPTRQFCAPGICVTKESRHGQSAGTVGILTKVFTVSTQPINVSSTYANSS